jgi:hypothetical protein
MGDIFTTIAIITGVALRIEIRAQYARTTEVVVTEVRPASLAEADRALAAYGFRRVRDWDLDSNGGVEARLQMIDNSFNGTRAARLDQAVGTTHDEFELVLASSVNNGDLITDADRSAIYVVGGSSTECGVTKLHQVGEGQTWDDHYTGSFEGLVWCARRKA